MQHQVFNWIVAAKVELNRSDLRIKDPPLGIAPIGSGEDIANRLMHFRLRSQGQSRCIIRYGVCS